MGFMFSTYAAFAWPLRRPITSTRVQLLHSSVAVCCAATCEQTFESKNIFFCCCYCVMNMNKNVVYARHRERCLNVEQTATSLRSLSLACSLLCLIVQLHDVSCLFLDCCAMFSFSRSLLFALQQNSEHGKRTSF